MQKNKRKSRMREAGGEKEGIHREADRMGREWGAMLELKTPQNTQTPQHLYEHRDINILTLGNLIYKRSM